MRLRKIFYLIFTALFIFLALSFASCKQSKLTITNPGKEVLASGAFGKIKDGVFGDGSLVISNGGKNITIGDVNYERTDDSISTTNANGKELEVGIFKNTNTNTNDNSNDKLLVIQGEDSTIAVSADDKGIDAVKKAFEEFGPDKTIGFIMGAQDSKYQKEDGTIDVDKYAEDAKMTINEREKFTKIFGDLGKDNFGNPKIYKKTS